MNKLQKYLSLGIMVVVSSIGALLAGFEGFLLGLVFGATLAWGIMCYCFVPDLTATPVTIWPGGRVVRVLKPRHNFIFWPFLKPAMAISTELTNADGVTPFVHSSDGVTFQVTWWIRYRLEPAYINVTVLTDIIHQLQQNPKGLLKGRIEIALREMISQKSASSLISREGRHYLMRYFSSHLRQEAEHDGFWIEEANIFTTLPPADLQEVFNQAAGIQADIGAVENASQAYSRMTEQYSPGQLDWIRRMEIVRAMRKGGGANHILHNE